MKKFYILLLGFFLLSNVFPFMPSSIVADTGISINDVTGFSDSLITELSMYTDAGYDLDKVVNPVVYRNQVLCEGHLPLVLDVDLKKQVNLVDSAKDSFLSVESIGKFNIDSIDYKYRVLMREDFSYDIPVFSYECWNCFNKSSGKYDRCCIQNFTGYETVNDYRYVWKEVKDLGSIVFKTSNKIVVDVQGNFKSDIISRGVDVVPTVKIGEYSNRLSKYAWWNSDWTYKKQITIDSDTLTGGDVTLTNFPLHIYIKEDSDLASHARTTGKDIAFLNSAEDTQYYHEIEHFNSSSGNLSAFVNITSLPHDSNLTIYMYYGNDVCVAQGSPTSVWDDDVYSAVWHFNNATDSTSNDYDLTDNAQQADEEDWSFGPCYYFDGNDYCRILDCELNLYEWSIEGIAHFSTETTGVRGIFEKRTNGANDKSTNWMIVEPDGGDTIRGHYGEDCGTAVEGALDTSESMTTSSWVHFTYVRDNTANDAFMYGNGDLDNTDSSADDYPCIVGVQDLYIGCYLNPGSYFVGFIDELRVSKTVFTDDYIFSNYNTTINPVKYLDVGSEETEVGANNQPYFSNPVPVNESTGQLRPPVLSIDIADADADSMDLRWYSNSSGSWVLFGSNLSVNDGTFTQTNSNFSSSNTVYYWNCSVNDGQGESNSNNNSGIYHFTTLEGVDDVTSFDVAMYNDSQLNISWTKGVNSTHTRIQRDTSSYPTSISEGTNVYNDTGSSYDDTGLSGSTEYFYSAFAYNSTLNEWSSSYDKDRQETLPQIPQNFNIWVNNDTSISMSWDKGTGADRTVVRYYDVAYPSSPTNGTEAYNESGTSVEVNGLTTGVTYYFRLWSFDTSSNFSYNNVSGSATTSWVPSSPSNLNVSSISVSEIRLNWSKGNGSRSVVVRKIGSYPSSHTDGTEVYNNTDRFYNDTSLSTSVHYYYNVYSFNNSLWSTPVQGNNWTFPQSVQNSTASQEGGSHLNISWDVATGADNTVINSKNGGYPSSRADGSEVYNGSALFFNDTGYSSGDYYSMWSYNNSSKMYSSIHQLLWGGLTVNVYNESSALAISNWDMFVTNEAGDDTSEHTSQSNGASYDINTIPHGDKTTVIISADGYNSRVYYMDLDVSEQYTLNAYLTNSTDSELYLISVINPYSEAVKDAKIIFKRSIGGSYVNMSVMYTDANGQVNLYLIPNILYKVEILKSGFVTEYSDYIPSDSIYTHTFELDFSDPSYSNETNIDEIIIFEGYLSSVGNLLVNYTDSSLLTSNTNIIIYEVNNSDGNVTPILWDNKTNNNSFSLSYNNLNSSNCYEVVLYFNHSLYGSSQLVRIICHTKTHHDITSSNWFDSVFTANYGTNPFGWSNFIGFIVLIIVLMSMGQQHTGLALIICGGFLMFFNNIIGFHFLGVVVPVLFVVLGVLVLWRMSNKSGGNP